MRLARRITVLLSMLIVAVGIGAVPTTAAFADPIPTDFSVWKEIYPPFISPTSLKCLDVPDGSTSVGTELQLWHCHGYDRTHSAMQRFQFLNLGPIRSGGPEHYWIVNTNSGLCIAASMFALVVEQTTCSSDARTEWFFTASLYDINVIGSPGYYLVNQQSPGYCMAARDNHSGDGTPVILQPCRAIEATTFTDSVQIQDFRLG